MDDGEMYLGWSWIMPSYRKFPKYHNPQAAALLYEGRTGCFVWRIDGRTWQKQTNYEGGNKTKVSRYARAEQNRAQQDTSSTCSHSSQVLEGSHQLGSVKSSKVKILAIAAGEPRRHVARHISAARTRDTWHVTRDTLLSSSVTTSRRIYPTFMTNGMMLSRFCHLSVSHHR